MMYIFSYFILFSFFIWSCSVLMMQLRCESAVTQGLRSDVLQATKTWESAGLHPKTPISFGLQIVDQSPLTTSLAPHNPKSSAITNNKQILEVIELKLFPKLFWAGSNEGIRSLTLTGVECEPVWSQKCWGDIGLRLNHPASEDALRRHKTRASVKVARNALTREMCDSSRTPRRHGLVAPALQGPSLAGNVPHLRLRSNP